MILTIFSQDCNFFGVLHELIESSWNEFWVKIPVWVRKWPPFYMHLFPSGPPFLVPWPPFLVPLLPFLGPPAPPDFYAGPTTVRQRPSFYVQSVPSEKVLPFIHLEICSFFFDTMYTTTSTLVCISLIKVGYGIQSPTKAIIFELFYYINGYFRV